MLDHRFILQNVERVKQNCINRGLTVDVDRFVELEAERKTMQAEIDQLNREANQISKASGKARKAADEDEWNARQKDGRNVRGQIAAKKAEFDALMKYLNKIWKAIPNMAHPDAPIGADDKANLELFQGKTPVPAFEFKPLDHVELAEKLDLIDFEGGARVAGHGFYFLKNELVLLELALQHYALNLLIGEGFVPMTTPDLASNEILEGIGFNPRGPETQIYSIENTDLSLIATAEITLGGLMLSQMLDAEQLPIRFCGISHCFRTEAGAHGRATRGLYRVHQFTKIEMFVYTLPEESDAMLDELRDIECRLFDGLGVPYRVVDTATGDLGAPAYRKFDLEAWMPGRGEWGEITSTSNCTDYQANRLNIRYKVKGEKGTRPVHTLNGTAVAIPRAVIAIMENYQQADGSIVIPKVLRPLVGKDRIGPA